MAEKQMEKLQAEGIAPTFEEIIWLNELGLAAEEPGGEVCQAMRGEPVRCGNVTLWPLTVGAHGWFYDRAIEHYETEDGITIALAFALANSREPSAFQSLLTQSEIRDEVNAWAFRCGATIAELRSGINRAYPTRDEPHPLPGPNGQDDRKPDRVRIIAELVVGTGLPSEYWSGHPMGDVTTYIQAIHAQRAAGALGDTEKQEALRLSQKLLQAADAIRAAHKPEATHGEG
jgi:hypothetical protein